MGRQEWLELSYWNTRLEKHAQASNGGSPSLGGKVLSVFDKASGVTTWKRDYIHRGSLQLGKATPAAAPKDKLHFTLDHLGSTRLVSLDNGKTLETHHFFTYGEEFSGARASEEKLLFTGHERDKNGIGTVDDLDYMHARYYGPQLGRFLSADPIHSAKLEQPQSWNKYSYAANSPMMYVDINGEEASLALGGIWAGSPAAATSATAAAGAAAAGVAVVGAFAVGGGWGAESTTFRKSALPFPQALAQYLIGLFFWPRTIDRGKPGLMA